MLIHKTAHMTMLILAGLFVAVTAASCGRSAPAPILTPMPAATIASTPTSASSPTALPTRLPTTAPSTAPTVAPTSAPTVATALTPVNAETTYLDNRSDAAALIDSLYNAINQHQYARAYSYWEDSPQRPGFDQFQAGYQDTASVQVTLGAIGLGAAAGNLYAPVPVTLSAKSTTGATQTYVGCYMLHVDQPAMQATLPFMPWGIQSATVTQVDNNANTADLMSHACDSFGSPPIPQPQPTADPNDISMQRYIDNRSEPIELLRSMFNAINLNEYVRAYSYWESGAQNLPDLAQFEQGYGNTQAVTLTTGPVTSDAGAGQFHYQVPVTLKSQLKDGTIQTFVGCYQLHLSNPDMQTVPPFQPMAIESANVKQVANDADTSPLMNQICGMP
jgi:hypothetical protein